MISLPRNAGWIGAPALIVMLFVLRSYAIPVAEVSNDIKLYAWIGEEVLRGAAELRSEYPPLSSSLFAALRAVPWGYPAVWTGFLAACAAIASAYAWRRFSARDGLLVLFAFCATALLLSLDVVFCRYDILVGLLLLLSWLAHRDERDAESMVFLVLASALKLVPLVLLPLIVLATPRSRWKALSLGFLAGVLFSVTIPLLVLGWSGTLSNLAGMSVYHTTRGLQVESLWSGASMLLRMFQGEQSSIDFVFGAQHNLDLGGNILRWSGILGLLGMLSIYVIAFKRRHEDVAAPLMLTALLWLFIISPVLSPQYFTWIFPLLLFWCIQQFHDDRLWSVVILMLTILLALLTHWIYPGNYAALVFEQQPAMIVILNIRNALIVVLAGIYLKRSLRSAELSP